MKHPKRNTLTLPAALLFILAALLMALDASEMPNENPPGIHSTSLAAISAIPYTAQEEIPAG